MKQVPMPRKYKCAINPKRRDVPASIIHLRPIVYKEGEQFCCLLGNDPQADVWGCGKTPELAMKDWDSQLKTRLQASHVGDRLVVQIRRILKHAQQRGIWKRKVEN